MKPALVVLFSALLIICACKHSKKKTLINKKAVEKPVQPDTSGKNIKPVYGYRFSISGDFNGDGKQEKLTEHFISTLTNREADKFYTGLKDYDQLVDLTMKKKPSSFVTCNDKLIETLTMATKSQLFGLSYLKNEGDLDGDGADEVSYVVNWADWSNLNTWHIVTYKNGKWKSLYEFSIWDWQIPDLPQTYNQYGSFGFENKIINTDNIEANKLIKKNLDDFKGLVKKVAKNKIQIIYMNDEAVLDTAVIKLKPGK